MTKRNVGALRPALGREPRKRGPRTATRPEDAIDAPAALLDAASDLLRERNGVEPTVIEIADRAGLNAGLIGYYFGSKDAMFAALLERDMRPSIDALAALAESDAPVVDKLRSNITGMINLHYKYPYLNQLLLTLVGRSDADRAKELSELWIKPVCDGIERILSQGRQSGELREIDPMLYYYTVQGACDRMFSARYTLRNVYGIAQIDRTLKQRLVEHTIAILLPGVLTRAGA